MKTRPAIYPKTCDVCGGRFLAKTPNTRRCSIGCRVAYHREYQRIRLARLVASMSPVEYREYLDKSNERNRARRRRPEVREKRREARRRYNDAAREMREKDPELKIAHIVRHRKKYERERAALTACRLSKRLSKAEEEKFLRALTEMEP